MVSFGMAGLKRIAHFSTNMHVLRRISRCCLSVIPSRNEGESSSKLRGNTQSLRRTAIPPSGSHLASPRHLASKKHDISSTSKSCRSEPTWVELYFYSLHSLASCRALLFSCIITVLTVVSVHTCKVLVHMCRSSYSYCSTWQLCRRSSYTCISCIREYECRVRESQYKIS